MVTIKGYPSAIITGGRSGSIVARFKTCGIGPDDVYLGSRDKIADFNDFCRKYSLKHEDVLYIGDDIPDMEVLSMCGIGVSPADGVACNVGVRLLSGKSFKWGICLRKSFFQ